MATSNIVRSAIRILLALVIGPIALLIWLACYAFQMITRYFKARYYCRWSQLNLNQKLVCLRDGQTHEYCAFIHGCFMRALTSSTQYEFESHLGDALLYVEECTAHLKKRAPIAGLPSEARKDIH